MFPSISIGLALLIGASLAPTDAALGQPVVTNPSVPARIRRVLNVESGLNDGIATPFVFFALALATAEGAGATGICRGRLVAIVVGLVAGVAIGMAGGWLLRLADRKNSTSALSRQLFVLALAGSCYLVSVTFGGNGFIAAFVGGLAFGTGSGGSEDSAVRFTETQGSLLAIGVWLSFGLVLAGELSTTTLWDIRAIAYAVLSLTLIRMIPVAIALLGEPFSAADPAVRGLVWTARTRFDRVPDHWAREPERGRGRSRAIRRRGHLDGAVVRDPSRPYGTTFRGPIRAPNDLCQSTPGA